MVILFWAKPTVVSPQFSFCTPSHYLGERRISAPFDWDIPIPGRFGEFLWRSWIFPVKNQGLPNNRSGGQFSLPGSPGTNLHTMSWVLSRASLVLAILPNFQIMWEFVKNLVFNKLWIFTKWKKRQKLQILMVMEQSSTKIVYNCTPSSRCTPSLNCCFI